MNSILKQDLEEISNSILVKWSALENSTILITGATGLIGSILVRSILLRNENYNSNIKMVLLVRNLKDAINLFGKSEYIKYEEKSVEEYITSSNIDYIIHGASPTKSKFFIEKPVETLDTSVLGTKNILEIAKKNNIKSMVYMSSMEMYGVIEKEDVSEDDIGYIDVLNVRSSYSEGKRIAELYCYSYFSEYDVPVKIARIAQTFGAGVFKNENRVFKIFADSILDKKDIVLKSEGTTNINFSYTTDTIIGLLVVLINGISGEAYNVVGEKTNMTILDSAKWLAEKYGAGIVNVKFQIQKENSEFAPNNKMILNNDKLKSIGWVNKYNLKQGYDRLVKYLEEERKNET